jgi:hypothetical protein
MKRERKHTGDRAKAVGEYQEQCADEFGHRAHHADERPRGHIRRPVQRVVAGAQDRQQRRPKPDLARLVHLADHLPQISRRATDGPGDPDDEDHELSHADAGRADWAVYQM